MAKHIAVVNHRLPPHMVASQLMIFTPVGTAMNIVVAEKTATEMTGMAKTNRNCTTRIIHVKMGIFMRDMPGARMLRIVTIRFMALVSDAMPVIWMARAQKSTPWVGEKTTPLLGE